MHTFKRRAKYLLILFALWALAMIFAVGMSHGQEPYSFAVRWTAVDSDAPFRYQIGAGLVEGEYTVTKFIDSQWVTGNINVATPGPWYVAVRTCLTRADAEPLCSTTWTRAAQTQGGTDLGPFYPVQVVIPVVPEAWLASSGPGG